MNLHASANLSDVPDKPVALANLGGLPVSSYTAADVLAKLITVDGPGSLLDADFLDGLSSAAFMLAAGETAAALLAKIITVDGAGSLLDADFLDGLSSAAFYQVGGTDVPVADGGTGVSTLTNHGVLLGQGTSAVVVTAAMTDGQLLVGQTSADPLPKTISGDVTFSAAGVSAIGAGKVTLAMHADMATASVFYRKTAGSGAPEVNTLATLKTDLGLTGTNSGDQTITLTGDVTGTGTGSFAATIAASAVTLAKMANMATASLLGRNTAGTGAPEVLSAATALSLLGFAAWTPYTPTVTSGTGAFTTVSATGRSLTIGKTVWYTIVVTDTTNGTAATDVRATLPSTAAVPSASAGFTSAPKTVLGKITAADFTRVICTFYDGTYPGVAGQNIVISGCYEIA